MRGMPRILSLFRNEFNEFNNTGARLLDSIYHMTLRKITLKSHFCRKNVIFFSLCTQRCNGRHRPLAGYGLPPPQGEFCRPYFS